MKHDATEQQLLIRTAAAEKLHRNAAQGVLRAPLHHDSLSASAARLAAGPEADAVIEGGVDGAEHGRRGAGVLE